MIKKLFHKWFVRASGCAHKSQSLAEKAFRKGYEEGRKSMGYQPRKVSKESQP